MTLLGTVLGPVLGTVTVNVPQLMFNCKQTERERDRAAAIEVSSPAMTSIPPGV